MKISITTSSILVGLLPLTSFANSDLNPAINLDTLKANIVKYHESGAYENEVKELAAGAKDYLKTIIDTNRQDKNTQKLAIVLDIDETALSNYFDLLELGFGGTTEMQLEAEGRADDPAIAQTLELYQYAKQNDVTVFFVTGRVEKYRTATIKNLVEAGYDSVKQSSKVCQDELVTKSCTLYLRSGKFAEGSAIPYKTAMRQKITEAGYQIVLNIGDQYSDLAGGYSLKTIKYPNFMYYIG